jgi:hypothetical protein
LVRFLRGVAGTAITLGFLTALCSAANSAPGHTFTVSARNPAWQDTRLYIRRGMNARVVVTGGNGTCHPGAPGCPRKPEGAGFLCSKTALGQTYPNGPAGAQVPYGAVAGRIGPRGKPFLIGRHVTVTGPGELYLVYNDCEPPAAYRDNRGAWTVSVTAP